MKLGILGSTKGTDLQAIFDAISSHELKASVSVVISNQKNSYILERAKKYNVPSVFISHTGKSREDFDREITVILQRHDADLVLLIGFMRILSKEFCRRMAGQNFERSSFSITQIFWGYGYRRPSRGVKK